MSIPGILAITQVVLNAIVFMCSICSGWCFRGQSFFVWAELVSSIGFWVSLTLFLLQFINQLTGVRERMFQIIKFWNFIEAGIVALWCFFFFTVFLDCAIKSTWNLVCYSYTVLNLKTSHQADRGVIGAAAFFCFCCHGCLRGWSFFPLSGMEKWPQRQSNRSTKVRRCPQHRRSIIFHYLECDNLNRLSCCNYIIRIQMKVEETV